VTQQAKKRPYTKFNGTLIAATSNVKRMGCCMSVLSSARQKLMNPCPNAWLMISSSGRISNTKTIPNEKKTKAVCAEERREFILVFFFNKMMLNSLQPD